MSNYLKFFKGEFEKYAVPYTPRKSRQTAAPPTVTPPVGAPVAPPGAPTATPVAPSTAPVRKSKLPGVSTAPHPVAKPGSYSVPAVKEMQKAILNLANVLSASDVTSMQGNREGLQEGPQSRAIPAGPQVSEKPTTNDKEYLGGSDPFGNFIVQHYLSNSAGKQLLNVDVAGGKNRMDASMAPKSLRGVIDSIKRIGTPGSAGTEKAVDGVWQDRTNNSLHLIAELATAMQQLVSDMGVPSVPGIPPKRLAEFASLIPKSYRDMKSSEEISQKAQQLTPYLNAIATFFTNLKPAVLENKEIRKFVDQKEPFAKYPKVNFPPELGKFGLPGVTFDFVQDPAQNWISLEELSNPDAFRKFLMRVGVGPTPETMKEVLTRLDRSLNTRHETKSQLDEVYK